MDFQNIDVRPIHRCPELMKQCCRLINDEWPRSETARMAMLQASCDNLPTSLVLISHKETVLGHCKLTRIPSIAESCFLEAVVISKTSRGKKLGTYLMRQVEQYCKNVLKLKMVHLSTKGQENFYAKLGYEICAPISIYGFFVPNGRRVSSIISEEIKKSVPNRCNKDEAGNAPPPPPPPPMPTKETTPVITSNKTYMFKCL